MISSQIRMFRKRMKLTQDELAERLGINRATISKYESGVIVPPIEQIRKIAHILDVSLIDILDLQPEGDKQEDRVLLTQLISELFSSQKDFPVEMLSSLYYFDENGLRFDDGIIRELIETYESLNIEGKRKALERITELSEIPKYQSTSPKRFSTAELPKHQLTSATSDAPHPAHSSEAMIQKYREQGYPVSDEPYHESANFSRVASPIILPTPEDTDDKK